MNKPYFIAEIGVNYYDTAQALDIQPIEAAKMYISEAKEAGIDAVKFQSYKAETLASKNSPSYWDLSQEPTTSQYELFRKFDSLGKEEYAILHDYALEIGIDFISTPFDYDSADYLEPLLEVYKISSSDITNIPFLEYIAAKGKPIILSTGATDEKEIDVALNTIQRAGCNDITLLHCVLAYPTRFEDANLQYIPRLRNRFPSVKIGYSDHTMPDEAMSILTAACALGAEVIEKHFTLDKALKGNDHYHAMDPKDAAKAVEAFEHVCKGFDDSNQIRQPLECEQQSRKQARRSLYYSGCFKQGHIISRTDLSAKRPGTGLAPHYILELVGRQLVRDVEEDTQVSLEHFV